MAGKPTYEELEQRIQQLEKAELARKRTEEELPSSENKYKLLFEASTNGIMAFDVETKRFIYANPSVFKMFGYSEIELQRMCIADLHPQDSLDYVISEFESQVRGEKTISSDLPCLRKDGTIFYADIAGANTIINGQKCSVGFITDVSERKRAEETLKAQTKTLNDILEKAADGICVCHNTLEAPYARFTHWNPCMIEITGYTIEEINRLGWYQSMYPDPKLQQKAIERMTNMRKGDDIKAEEWVITTKSGTKKTLSMSTSIVKEENGKVHVLAIMQDITEQKQIEGQLRQAQKMEAIGTLAVGIAREFNNVLGIVIGNTELAIDDVPEWNPAHECLKEIRSASLRAKDVVRQIVSFTRKTPATRKPINIGTVFKESLNLIRATIPTSIEIRQEFLCDHEMILANPTEINQILLNLCSNSVDAMEEEIGILEVKLETVILDDRSVAQYKGLAAGEHVKLTVKDNGIGMDSKTIDRIFDPYFTTKDFGKGVGMGLAIVHGLVKKHDGAIKVMSKLGKETTIEVLFPITKDEAETEVEASDALPKGTECILFVDDEPSLVKLVKQMFERQGCEVVGKTSSTEALKMFQEEPDRFDLIITDIAMPDMPGDRLVQKIIKIRPNIPIIICTGHSDRIDEEKAKELGIAAYTLKPLVKTDLVKTVRKVLDEAKKSH